MPHQRRFWLLLVAFSFVAATWLCSGLFAPGLFATTLANLALPIVFVAMIVSPLVFLWINNGRRISVPFILCAILLGLVFTYYVGSAILNWNSPA